MALKNLQQEIHSIAIEKGWYDEKRTPLEMHMLITTEIAEASEAVRRRLPPVCYYDMVTQDWEMGSPENGEKPEGEAVELADALIRILDYAESKAWNMDDIVRMKIDYNKTRGYKHGGKAL